MTKENRPSALIAFLIRINSQQRFYGVVLSVFLSLVAAQEATALETQLEFQRCQVEKGALIVDAECATLSVPLNPKQALGKHIDLSVVKFPARVPDPKLDALTIIQGGPGMSSIDLALNLNSVFSELRRDRDILIVDQRGTGRSHMLRCSAFTQDIQADFDPIMAKQLTRQCLEELEFDPSYFTTSVAVSDLEAVRKAAGYAQLNIYGVSYGTRVAQHYLRRFPQSTRSMVLDGVASVGVNLAGSEIAIRSQQALDAMFARCEADEFCYRNFGDLEEKFEQLRVRLKKQPQEVELVHPESGEKVTQLVGEDQLLTSIRLMPYSTETLALLPLTIEQAYQGNYLLIAVQALLTQEQFSNDYSFAMNNSVVCTEDAPFLTEADTQGLEETYFGTMMAEVMGVICGLWPRGPIDDDFREPFDSNVPVLILSGEADPITPPANGEAANNMLSNSMHIVVPGHGHGVVGRGCMPQLVSRFIKLADFTQVKPDCIDRERALPFFLDLAGPKP